ncbi:hypothetical protein ILUMI_06193 [Ignelater luminosus]|uniref:BRISC and BRCA1-A complex member 1 n=1 Tax=Ignelater luminosus TaxID=2038154 RepID=A0A8K0GCU2_IGNLU|nr:hypothetical protein ILUMI_06193 [Ignelater luminosus]
MSQNSDSSSGTNASKEHIIPIQLEKDKSVSNISSKLSLSARQSQTPATKNNVDSESDNDDSTSVDENNVICSSVKSLTLSSEQPQDVAMPHSPLTETEIIIPQRTLPSSNVPEKIIIVLDRALDENCFEIMSGKKYLPLFMLQHAIKLFLHNKTAIDNQHEFALVFLNENSATWIHDFTSSPQDIIRTIQSATVCEPEDIFDLNSVFDLIAKRVELDIPKNNLLIPPTFVVRTILLYGRSYSIPQLNKTNEIEELLDSPYFTLDVIMTHEPPSSANHCNRIFKVLQQIDTKGFGYSFSVSRNASDLHLAMAKIVSHPLQRMHQLNAKYDINFFN